jgi:SAM-dependent methyltransferase
MRKDIVKKAVRDGYARIAMQSSSCSCCGSTYLTQDISKKIGYTERDLEAIPTGANLGLGCGNPIAFASLREGEVVLDLGSGAGIDCFLAASKVGGKGRVIGVDMTLEMIEKARENARKSGYRNVEFVLGEIENLPISDNSIDAVISNCVINLSPDKKRVFQEAYRVLKPSGRLIVSDIVLQKELPDFIKNSIEAYIDCVSGAMLRDEYIGLIKAVGFQEVRIIDESFLPIACAASDPIVKPITEDLNLNSKMPLENLKEIAVSAISIRVYGVKPV